MQFYAPKFIEVELDKYEEKMLMYSGLQRNELLELRRSLLRRIELINHELIRPETWNKAIELTKEVDEKDAPFVALALELEGRLWTGDKKLIKGLQHKDYERAIDTEGLKKLSAE